jgi:pimeloyl-ACP methyl ester carboxylesterase
MQRLICALTLLIVTTAHAAEWPGTKDVWNGYDRYTFKHQDRNCYVVVPKVPAEGKPWVWRARFWGHRPEADIALLGKGYHIVFIDTIEWLGSPKCVATWDSFHTMLTTEHGLAKKAALEGMSRGGLYVYNFAAAHPDKVACIYADAPVCTFASWPGGKGKSKGAPKVWEQCKEAYGFKSDDEALAWKGNPIDNLAPLAAAKIPLLHVVGDVDDVVPVDENTAILEQRYKALGGEITVIHKPGIGHKHGLDDATPIVEFIVKHTSAGAR